MDVAMLLTGAGLALLGYLLGSVSSAIVVCRLLRLPDPRAGGSGNPGATNVLRLAGRRPAAATLAGDVLKGVAAVLIARAITGEPLLWVLAGAGAFLGHIYPVFFAFRGGKGVATALGVLAAVSPLAGGLAVLTWGIVFAITRISSLSALVAFALTPVYMAVVTESAGLIVVTTAMVVLLFWRHRDNIGRLLDGEEGRPRSQ